MVILERVARVDQASTTVARKEDGGGGCSGGCGCGGTCGGKGGGTPAMSPSPSRVPTRPAFDAPTAAMMPAVGARGTGPVVLERVRYAEGVRRSGVGEVMPPSAEIFSTSGSPPPPPPPGLCDPKKDCPILIHGQWKCSPCRACCYVFDKRAPAGVHIRRFQFRYPEGNHVCYAERDPEKNIDARIALGDCVGGPLETRQPPEFGLPPSMVAPKLQPYPGGPPTPGPPPKQPSGLCHQYVCEERIWTIDPWTRRWEQKWVYRGQSTTPDGCSGFLPSAGGGKDTRVRRVGCLPPVSGKICCDCGEDPFDPYACGQTP